MDNTRKTVFFCGENPGMSLYAAGVAQPIVVLSYWQCSYSAAGAGQVLVLWYDEAWDATEAPISGIYTNNPTLARLLVETLTCYFPEFEDLPITSLPYILAFFEQSRDEQQSYLVRCSSSITELQITWSDMFDHYMVLWPDFPIQPRSYDLSTVICPCAQASIAVNGLRLPLEVKCMEQNGQRSSSAFLAFAESWLGPN